MAQMSTYPELKKQIREFIESEYETQVQTLSSDSENTFTIDYGLLKDFDEIVATELRDDPSAWINEAKSAIKDMRDDIDEDLLYISVKNYDEYNPIIRELREYHANKLVRIDGTVSKATKVLPKAEIAAFRCQSCGSVTRVRQPMESDLKYPLECKNEECSNSSESRFRVDVNSSETIDFRKIEIQEHPEDVSGGQTPENETFTIKGTGATSISAGDSVTAIGIYRHTEQDNTSIFGTYIEGIDIEPQEKELDELEITDEDEEKILEYANRDDIYDTLIQSIAPNLYGLENEKEAILYQLFRGVRKQLRGSTIRGDIHTLLVGDPGVGKSQLLRYASKISPRGVMTSGKGSSAAGLTAAAVRDSEFGSDRWTLEAGALVLADQGLACVDEIDKMSESDRSSMHEALEQQTVSVNKAGINSTLKSRCTLLAAANPTDGRWNDFDPIAEQIDLEPALISRFDLIFAPKDEQSKQRDENIAEHVLITNLRGEQVESGVSPDSKTDRVEPEVDPELFRKYVAYARQNCNPIMTEEARQTIQDFYVDIRQDGKEEGAVPITTRKIEAIIRISEAVARVEISDEITEKHAKRAINIILESLKDIGYDEQNDRFDIDMAETNQSTSQRDRRNMLTATIEDLDESDEFDDQKGVPKDKIIEIFEEKGFDPQKIEEDLKKLAANGELFEPTRGRYSVL